MLIIKFTIHTSTTNIRLLLQTNLNQLSHLFRNYQVDTIVEQGSGVSACTLKIRLISTITQESCIQQLRSKFENVLECKFTSFQAQEFEEKSEAQDGAAFESSSALVAFPAKKKLSQSELLKKKFLKIYVHLR